MSIIIGDSILGENANVVAVADCDAIAKVELVTKDAVDQLAVGVARYVIDRLVTDHRSASAGHGKSAPRLSEKNQSTQ